MPATKTPELFRDPHCVPALAGTTKEEVISELIECFVTSGALPSPKAPRLYGEVLDREAQGTTGIGAGIALPHTRSSKVVPDMLVAVGLHGAGVDFEAADGAPVHVVFLLVAPDPALYLPVAGRIARLGRDRVEMKALRAQRSPEAIRTFLEECWGGATR
jgi:mannitol/fructose-specific phosphotransferase system IIA component (Ntr-type)